MSELPFKSTTIAGLVLVIACFAAGYFLALPQWDKYLAVHAQLQQAENDKANLNTTQSSIGSFINQYQGFKKETQTINLALPVETSDLSGLLSSIDSLAKASGVALAGLQIDERVNKDKPAPDNSIQSQALILSASGSYPSFKNFIQRLEKNLRLIDIQRVSLKADDTGQIQYQVNLKTYYQK